jgi:truncated hemoglobin YjbI
VKRSGDGSLLYLIQIIDGTNTRGETDKRQRQQQHETVSEEEEEDSRWFNFMTVALQEISTTASLAIAVSALCAHNTVYAAGTLALK